MEGTLLAVCGFLLVVAFLVVENELSSVQASVSCGSQVLEPRLNSFGTQASLLRGRLDLPGPGIKSVFLQAAVQWVSRACAGGIFPILHWVNSPF